MRTILITSLLEKRNEYYPSTLAFQRGASVLGIRIGSFRNYPAGRHPCAGEIRPLLFCPIRWRSHCSGVGDVADPPLRILRVYPSHTKASNTRIMLKPRCRYNSTARRFASVTVSES